MKNLPMVDLQSIFSYLIPFLLFSSLVDRTLCAPALIEGDDVENGGCYYMFNHYGEGDRIFTNEPCLNCTCHNSMLMCYLRVCPFTKPIGQDCTIEKKPDQCCPVISCPEVPVSLVTPSASTSTTPSTTSLATVTESSTELAIYDRGCNIDGKFYPDGVQVEGDPTKPCELCYCIRNTTACVMQECILHVEGCEPVFQPGVCCPVRYQCNYPPQITDESTTIAGLLTTTLKSVFTSTPVPGGCVRDGEYYADGSQIPGAGPCEHCYCMRGEIVCAVQECGAPLENAGGNCTAVQPHEGLCCPEKYSCDTDNATNLDESSTTFAPSSQLADEPELPSDEPLGESSTESSGVTEGKIPEVTDGPSQPIMDSEQPTTTSPVAQDIESPKMPEVVSSEQTETEQPAEESPEAATTQTSISTADEEEQKPNNDKENAILSDQVQSTEVPTTIGPMHVQDTETMHETDKLSDTILEQTPATTSNENLIKETSSETENLITSATENIIPASESSKTTKQPDETQGASTETPASSSSEEVATSSQEPEVTTLGTVSDESVGTSDETSTAVSSEPSKESSTESHEESQGAVTQTPVTTPEKSTDAPSDISGVGQPAEMTVDEPSTETPQSAEPGLSDDAGIKDHSVEKDEEDLVVPTTQATPAAHVPSSAEVSSETPEEVLPTTTSKSVAVAEEEKEIVATTLSPSGESDKMVEPVVPSVSTIETEEVSQPTTVSPQKETLDETATTVSPSVSQMDTRESSSTSNGPVEEGIVPTTQSSAAVEEEKVTEIPVSSSTVGSVAEDKISQMDGQGEVVGEIHVSSTPEPAESLSMHSSTTTPSSVSDADSDTGVVQDSPDAPDDTESTNLTSGSSSSTTSERATEQAEVQQPTTVSPVEDGEKEVQAVEKATEQPQPVMAPGEPLGEEIASSTDQPSSSTIVSSESESSSSESTTNAEKPLENTQSSFDIESETEKPQETPVSSSTTETIVSPVEPEDSEITTQKSPLDDTVKESEKEDVVIPSSEQTTLPPLLVPVSEEKDSTVAPSVVVAEGQQDTESSTVSKPEEMSATSSPIDQDQPASQDQPEDIIPTEEKEQVKDATTQLPETHTTQTPQTQPEDVTVAVSSMDDASPESQVTESQPLSPDQSEATTIKHETAEPSSSSSQPSVEAINTTPAMIQEIDTATVQPETTKEEEKEGEKEQVGGEKESQQTTSVPAGDFGDENLSEKTTIPTTNVVSEEVEASTSKSTEQQQPQEIATDRPSASVSEGEQQYLEVPTTQRPSVEKEEEEVATTSVPSIESEKGPVKAGNPEDLSPAVTTSTPDQDEESKPASTDAPKLGDEPSVSTGEELESPSVTTMQPQSVSESEISESSGDGATTTRPMPMTDAEKEQESHHDDAAPEVSAGGETESTVKDVVTPATVETASEISEVPTTVKPVNESSNEVFDMGVTVQPSTSPEISDMKNVVMQEKVHIATPTVTGETTTTDDGDVEEPPRVPGEGYCFVEGKTYKNGSSIPPTTPCHIVCACQNSIVHCLLVHCNPPPSDTGDCKPVYQQGVCCPTYDCDDDSRPTVTVTPGPEFINDTNVVTVTPETPSVEVTSESSEDPSAKNVTESVTTIAPIAPESESSESSVVSPSSEDVKDESETPAKPVHDDSDESSVEDITPVSVSTPSSTTGMSLIQESSPAEPDSPAVDESFVGSANATGDASMMDTSSPETPLSSSTPVAASVEDILGVQQIGDDEDEQNETSVVPPGSLYPVTTTTTVTPSTAPWPYPTSTPSPSVMSTGACLFDGRVFMSAQQIPRDDPCDFCFCFRGDIICLQQSCPPPIPGCYEEPIPGFCCPRYECPVGNGNSTTQQPSVFPPSYYHNQLLNGVGSIGNGAVAPNVPSGPGCEVQGEYYETGQIITSTSGPCLECRCGSTGMMECDPRECQPEPMLRKMIAAITSR